MGLDQTISSENRNIEFHDRNNFALDGIIKSVGIPIDKDDKFCLKFIINRECIKCLREYFLKEMSEFEICESYKDEEITYPIIFIEGCMNEDDIKINNGEMNEDERNIFYYWGG